MGTHKNYRSPVSELFCPHKTMPQHFNKRSCSDQGSRLLNMAELGSILLTNTRVTSIYQSPLSMCIISISDWLILCQLSSKILLSVSTVWELLTIQTISFANYYVLFLDTWHRYTLSGCLGENRKSFHKSPQMVVI